MVHGCMGSGLHAEIGCRKVYAEEVFERQKNSMEAKETIGDDGGRIYANSQFSNQNRQDAISRVGCAGQGERPKIRVLTVWRLKHTVISTV